MAAVQTRAGEATRPEAASPCKDNGSKPTVSIVASSCSESSPSGREIPLLSGDYEPHTFDYTLRWVKEHMVQCLGWDRAQQRCTARRADGARRARVQALLAARELSAAGALRCRPLWPGRIASAQAQACQLGVSSPAEWQCPHVAAPAAPMRCPHQPPDSFPLPLSNRAARAL